MSERVGARASMRMKVRKKVRERLRKVSPSIASWYMTMRKYT